MGKTNTGPYRQQIARLVNAMSFADHEQDIVSMLSDDSKPLGVKIFVDGNLQKRFEKIQTQLQFVAGAFTDFDEMIVAYINECLQSAYDISLTDGERMLQWILRCREPSPVQRDYIECQRARHTIENLARINRLQHIRFQEIRSLVDRFIDDLETNPFLKIYLNPIRTWTRFSTDALLDEEANPPTDVLFFAVGDEVSTAVLEPEGQVFIRELEDFGPCTLNDWAALTGQADRELLGETTRDLAEMGLVAFG